MRQVQDWLVPDRPPTPPDDMIDDEGNPDVFRRLIDRLRDTLVIDEPVSQHKSFDWLIDHRTIKPLLADLASRPAFCPRQGELVLFVRGLKSHQSVSFDASQNQFAMWDDELGSLVELPPWEAGVITEVPQEPVETDDLVLKDRKTYDVNYSGFRIEPMSMVGSMDKHWSKRVAQVHVHAIRPFVLYREILKSTKPKNYHPTVQNALVATSTISLFSPYHFKGLWPTATIYCRGMFLGAEFIVPGDIVRLTPAQHTDQPQILDVMKVTSIKINFFHLDVRDNPNYDDPTTDVLDFDKQHDCSVQIDGIAFTRDQGRAYGTGRSPLDHNGTGLPAILRQSDGWYQLHDPEKRWRVPFSRILGRYLDHTAMNAWFATSKSKGDYPVVQGFAAINASQDKAGSGNSPCAGASFIDKGLEGLLKGRAFSTQRDPRIQRDQGKAWFWANHRVEQLDLHEVKGHVTSTYFQGKPVREPGAWRRALNVRERGAGHRPKEVPGAGSGAGRKKVVERSSLQTGTAAEETLADVLGVDEMESGTETNYESAHDIIMEDAPDTVTQEEAYIDPNQIEIASDEASSEVESDDDDMEE